LPLLHAGAQRTASPRDSVAAHRAASTALRNFQYQSQTFVVETHRALDVVPNLSGTCELRIGDFCYGPTNGRLSFGGIGTHNATRVLSQSVLAGRWRRLADAYVNLYVSQLRTQRSVIPGDRWIVGEIVRIHVENGYLGRAEDELKECKSDVWWCGALRAYVQHLTGDWAGADTAWSHVLQELPASERCAWLDPSPVVEEASLRRFIAELPCAERNIVSHRFWWLSDPLFSSPGNERRSAHFARIVAVTLDFAAHKRIWATPAMLRDSDFVPTMEPPMIPDMNAPLLRSCGSFGNGNYSLGRGIVRFMVGYVDLVQRLGVPYHCGPVDSAEYEGPVPMLIAQYPLHRISFVPSGAAVRAPSSARPTDWNLYNTTAYEFFADWTKPVAEMAHQAAFFRRGDSARLVVATDGRPPKVPHLGAALGERMIGTLSLQSDFDKPNQSFERDAFTPVVFSTSVLPERTLASIEANFTGGDMGRVRFGAAPPDMPSQGVALSDILLLRYTGDLPEDLEGAEKIALGTTRLVQGAAVGLFWEIYGLPAGSTPRLSLMVVRQRGDEPLRLGRSEQRISGADVVVTEWDEAPAAGLAIEPRALSVSMATLTSGRYTLSLAVLMPGQPAVETVRTIEIVR
jgi:hypothetical protein